MVVVVGWGWGMFHYIVSFLYFLHLKKKTPLRRHTILHIFSNLVKQAAGRWEQFIKKLAQVGVQTGTQQPRLRHVLIEGLYTPVLRPHSTFSGPAQKTANLCLKLSREGPGGLPLSFSQPRSLSPCFPDCSFLFHPILPQRTPTKWLALDHTHCQFCKTLITLQPPSITKQTCYNSGFMNSTIWICCCQCIIRGRLVKLPKSKEFVLKKLWRNGESQALSHSGRRRVSLQMQKSGWESEVEM